MPVEGGPVIFFGTVRLGTEIFLDVKKSQKCLRSLAEENES